MADRAKNDRGANANAPEAISIPTDNIALVAGGGSIPVMVAQSLADAGNPPFVAMLEGDADESLSQYEHMRTSTALIGRLIAELKKRAISKTPTQTPQPPPPPPPSRNTEHILFFFIQ